MFVPDRPDRNLDAIGSDTILPSVSNAVRQRPMGDKEGMDMTTKNQLRISGERLQVQSALLFEQTRKAGDDFFADARGATVEFAEDLATATRKFAGRTSESANTFGLAMRKEVRTWGQLIGRTPSAYFSSFGRTREGLRRSTVEGATSMRPDQLETAVLHTVRDVLATIQKGIDARLAREKTVHRKPLPIRKSAPAKAAAVDKGGRAPIRNYDQLTARDVVTRLRRLPAPRATEVLAYEKAGKNRATVIRAAEQRAMAS